MQSLKIRRRLVKEFTRTESLTQPHDILTLILGKHTVSKRKLNRRHQLAVWVAILDVRMILEPHTQESDFRLLNRTVDGDPFDKPQE
jgi:hypothetical protein